VIAIVLVGGEGTRLRPLTLDRPKPMLPIAGRPFLAWLLDRLAAASVSRVVFSCGYLPDAIVAAFGDHHQGMRLEYAVEPEPLDTAGAIRFAADGRVDAPFLALNGDVLAAFSFAELVAFHAASGARATLTLTRVDDPTRYGLVLADDDGRVHAFVEKPEPHEAPPPPYWINAGAYLLDPSVLAMIHPGVRVNIERDVFPRLATSGLYGWRCGGYWNDIGTPASYLAANRDALNGALSPAPLATIDRSALVADTATLTAPYVIGRDARIGAGARVGPCVVVGAGADVGADAQITNSVLHEQCVVGYGAVLDQACVGRGAMIGTAATLDDHAVIGAGVTIRDGDTIRHTRVYAEDAIDA
jgi:NDP-sugar pyrophosphorylase family protein